jgi:hypothetical protein
MLFPSLRAKHSYIPMMGAAVPPPGYHALYPSRHITAIITWHFTSTSHGLYKGREMPHIYIIIYDTISERGYLHNKVYSLNVLNQ